MNVVCLIGAHGRQHLEGFAFLGELLMEVQVIHRIISGAHGIHAHAAQEGATREILALELFVALVVNGARSAPGQCLGDAEVAAKLHMGPQLHGAAYGFLHGFRVGIELVPRVAVAGDQFLGHAVGAFQTPLVVITIVVAIGEPSGHDIREIRILADLLRVQMTVIVNHGHGFGMVVEQILRQIGGQQEIVVKVVHSALLHANSLEPQYDGQRRRHPFVATGYTPCKSSQHDCAGMRLRNHMLQTDDANRTENRRNTPYHACSSRCSRPIHVTN